VEDVQRSNYELFLLILNDQNDQSRFLDNLEDIAAY